MFRLSVQNSIRVITKIKDTLRTSCPIRRNLYAPSTLGIDGYLQTRERVNGQFANSTDRFREKMRIIVEDQPTNMIFTEDLKNMIHLAENNSRDIELIVKMVKKFNSQSKDLRFGNYVFGPVLLRMFNHLGEADVALACFKDPELEGFFDQLVSYQLILDLLYESGRYQDVLDVFEIIQSRQIQSGKYSRHVVVLVTAACYKMNTPESFDYCLKLLREIKEVGYVPMRKAAGFTAGLALSQNAPHIALEIIANQKSQHYSTMRNIKALAYASLNRPEDAVAILRSVLEIDNPAKPKSTFIREVINKVRESIEKNERTDLLANFNRIQQFFIEQGHISDQTLNDILCTEITETGYTARKRDRSLTSSTYSKDNYSYDQRNNSRRNTQQRQGLADLY